MQNPYEMLGVEQKAGPEQIRAAYHALVKRWHPDAMGDEALRHEAQQKLIEINLAYEEALKNVHRCQGAPVPNAMQVARKLMEQGYAEAGLSILGRATVRDGEWFYLQGCLLLKLKRPQAAHESFRAAVRKEPDNQRFRQGALDAALAIRKLNTLSGKMGSWARRVAHWNAR